MKTNFITLLIFIFFLPVKLLSYDFTQKFNNQEFSLDFKNGHINKIKFSYFYNQQKIDFKINTIAIDEVLKGSDFISLHLVNHEDYIITSKEFEKMKDGVGFINTAKGGILNEVDLVNAIESGKVQYAGLDVFETEPTPAVQLLMNPEISLSPNIGSSTKEAQERIGFELANQIISLLN